MSVKQQYSVCISKHTTTLLSQRRTTWALSNNLSQLGPDYLLKGDIDWDDHNSLIDFVSVGGKHNDIGNKLLYF